MTKASDDRQAIVPSAFPATLVDNAYYADEHVVVLHMQANEAIELIDQCGLLCNAVITSPPYYGQRDYGYDGQWGLEDHPERYIRRLVGLFSKISAVLVANGSVWLNLGDTYWSGKGRAHGGDEKQAARRFGLRPQDCRGDGLWCRPKQLLLIPQRVLIQLQEAGWIVRNDIVWLKPNPTPDPAEDRCPVVHEYLYHLVKQRWYYYQVDHEARTSVWTVDTNRVASSHRAAFPPELVRSPIARTVPPGGIVLDPFAGSGTVLVEARQTNRRAIGIDASRDYCERMAKRLSSPIVL